MPEISDWKAAGMALAAAAACGAYLYRAMARMQGRGEEGGDGGQLTDMLVIAALVLFTIYQLKQAFLPLIEK